MYPSPFLLELIGKLKANREGLTVEESILSQADGELPILFAQRFSNSFCTSLSCSHFKFCCYFPQVGEGRNRKYALNFNVFIRMLI